MIIGFDWDGTLVESWTATPLPGVRERLVELPADTKTAIATNQAGPVWRAATGEEKYPSAGMVVERIAAGLQALNWRPGLLLIAVYSGQSGDDWRLHELRVASRMARAIARVPWFGPMFYAISEQPGDRKPYPGMLVSARSHFNSSIDCYIGDMETDHQAAIAAGCRYLDAAVWREKGLDL